MRLRVVVSVTYLQQGECVRLGIRTDILLPFGRQVLLFTDEDRLCH